MQTMNNSISVKITLLKDWCFEILRMLRTPKILIRVFCVVILEKWRNRFFIVQCVLHTSIWTIFLGVVAFYVSNLAAQTNFTFLGLSRNVNYFTAKHDILRIHDGISRLTDSPLERAVVIQAYQAYLSMTGNVQWMNESESIDTMEDYYSHVDIRALDDMNKVSSDLFIRSKRLGIVNNVLFGILVVIQGLNLVFSARLMFLDMKLKQA